MSVLDEVIEYLDYAQKYSNYIAAKCVFHDDNRPSLIIHEDYYKCLACDAKGKTENLLRKLKGLPTQPQIRGSFSNPFTKWSKMGEELPHSLKIAWQTLNEHPSEYLTVQRGITDETRRKLGIGWRDGWYTFPIRDECRKIVGAVARADQTNPTSAKYVTPSGQDGNLLYIPSHEFIKEQGYVYVLFGILDSVTMYQLGIASISTTGGKRCDFEAFSGIRKRCLFIPDKGEESDALNITKHMGWRGKTQKVNWPDDAKDVNDLWVKYPDRLKQSLGA